MSQNTEIKAFASIIEVEIVETVTRRAHIKLESSEPGKIEAAIAAAQKAVEDNADNDIVDLAREVAIEIDNISDQALITQIAPGQLGRYIESVDTTIDLDEKSVQ